MIHIHCPIGCPRPTPKPTAMPPSPIIVITAFILGLPTWTSRLPYATFTILTGWFMILNASAIKITYIIGILMVLVVCPLVAHPTRSQNLCLPHLPLPLLSHLTLLILHWLL